MKQRIINGVLLSQEEGRVDWRAETRSGLPVRFLPRLGGGVTPYIGEDDETAVMGPVYDLLADAVQWVRSQGVAFDPIAPNASARKIEQPDMTGWVVLMDGEDRTVFVPARGRHATVSDLHRRSDIVVTGPVAGSLVPVFFLTQ